MMRKKVFMFFLISIFMVALSYSASITVTNPHSGDTWYKGHTYTITWTKSGSMDSNVKIRLYQGSTKILNITDSTSNSAGSYTWLIPNSVPNGNYVIRVKTVDNAVFDNSDVFTIQNAPSGSITVTNPHPGVCWQKGNSYTITWTKSGSMDSNVKIRLYQGSTKILNITDSTSNSAGSYTWLIPNSVPNGNYVIRIKTLDNAIYDNSDSFSIKNSCSGGIHINPWIIERIKLARKIIGWGPWGPIGPDPDPDPPCPQCLKLNISKIREVVEPIDPYGNRGRRFRGNSPKILMVLYMNNEPVKELGVIEGGKIKFKGKFFRGNRNMLIVNTGRTIERGTRGFKLVFKNAKTGEIISSSEINLQEEKIVR